MKTLKKTLCLVLAVVMAVGVLTISASATNYNDFTDKDKIEHTTAVAVLNGMGIIGGKENDNFDPEGTLKRGEAAKMVVYALLGGTSAEKLTASASKFTDVAGHWAAKYISYAAQLNILQGNGDGTVTPEGLLTGYALAKMLLVAADVEGTYIGADWQNNVMLAATKNGFLDGIEDIDLGAEISRDDAAQMVWNAINYTPNGSSTLYLVTGPDNAVLYRGTDATMALLMKMSDQAGNKLTTTTTNEGSLGDTVYGLTDGTASDAWGRTVKTYTNGKEGSAQVVYASFDPTPAKSYTGATKVDKILSDLGYKYDKGATLTIVEDGETVVDAEKVTRVKEGASGTVASTIGGRGTLIEVFKDSADNYTAYVINTYVHKLVKDEITGYSSATADRDEIKANVTIDGATIYTDKFVKDDVVIYTVNKDSGVIVNMAKADTVSGKVTATGNGYIRVDGDQMYVARNAMAEDLETAAVVGTTAGYKYDADITYTFYKDFRDNVIAVKAGQEELPDTDYIYVDRIEAVATYGETTGDLFTNTGATNVGAKARVLHLDTGVVEVVNLGMVQNDEGRYFYAKANGAMDRNNPVTARADDVRTYYEYVVLADGSYVLVNQATKVAAVSLKKGQAKLGDGLFANSNTSTTVITYNADVNKTKTSKTAYTGYNSYPEKNFSSALYVANSNGIVSELYIVTDANIVEPVVPVNYAIFTGMGETTDVLHYGFYVKGEYVEYASEDAISLTRGVVYDISVDDGELVAATPVSENADITIREGVTVVTIEGEYFIGKSGDQNELFTFATDCLIVDAAENYAVAELAADDEIDIYVKDGKVELIVIAE